MDNPNAEKAAKVDEIAGKLEEAGTVLVTEYRGLDVPAQAQLRAAIKDAGGEYKIYKNTLVKLAANELGLDLDELLVGPTALAFVGEKADGSKGDPAAVAKALKEYSKTNDKLVIKGGLLDGKAVTAEEIKAIADLPSRETMLSEFAGAMESILGDFAGVLDAKLQEFVGCMDALIEKGGPSGGAGESAPTDAAPAEASADDASGDSDEEAASDSDEVAASDSEEE